MGKRTENLRTDWKEGAVKGPQNWRIQCSYQCLFETTQVEYEVPFLYFVFHLTLAVENTQDGKIGKGLGREIKTGSSDVHYRWGRSSAKPLPHLYLISPI